MSQPMALLSPDLTDAERRLIVLAIRGDPVDLGGARVRGSVLAELITAARPGWVLPRNGLEIARVVVAGGLDVAGATLPVPLTLLDSVIEADVDGGAMVLRETRIARLTLQATRIEGALIADRAVITGHLLIGDCTIAGALQARSAEISGSLAIEASRIGAGGMAIYASGVAVRGPLVVRRSRLAGFMSLPRARLDSGLQVEDIEIASESALALDLTSARCGGDLVLANACVGGGVALAGAEIAGQVLADGLASGAGGLDASGMSLARGLSIEGAKLGGPMRLEGTRIAGDISASGVEIHGGARSIAARLARVGGGIGLETAKLVGTLDIDLAEFGGDVVLSRARLFGAGAALDANGVRTGGHVLLDHAIVQGRVRLGGGSVGGRLVLSGASLKVDKGAALDAAGARFGGVLLDRGFNAVGALVLDHVRVEAGSVVLTGSHVVSTLYAADSGNGLDLRARTTAPGAAAGVTSEDAVAVSLAGARVARVVMPDKAEHRPRGIIDLSRADIGEYVDFAVAWPRPAGLRRSDEQRAPDHLVLDGFVCRHLVNADGTPPGSPQALSQAGTDRVAWLEAQGEDALVTRFRPQPWHMIAGRLAAQGHRAAARAVRIAAARRFRSGRDTSAAERWLGRLDDVLTLHGYAPWRPLVALAMAFALFTGLYAWAASECGDAACARSGAFISTRAIDSFDAGGHRQQPGGGFSAPGYALDALLPFLDLGYAAAWRIDPDWRPLLVRASEPHDSVLSGGRLLVAARAIETLVGLSLLILAGVTLWRSRRD